MSDMKISLTNKWFWATELSSRIFLLLLFLYLELQVPFQRIIHSEELWLYQNPSTKSYITGTHLWLFIVIPLPFLPFLYHFLSQNYIKFHYKRHDVISAILAITLLLPLNGVITNSIKNTVGRPRPDFAYRCWPKTLGIPENPSFLEISKSDEQNLHCHGDLKTIIDGRKSFPSGHSSFSFAVYIFCFLYLAGKFRVFAKRPKRSNSFDQFWTVKLLTLLALLLGNYLMLLLCIYNSYGFLRQYFMIHF